MNPITNAKNIAKLSEQELKMGIDTKNSWHNMYKDSAWIFIGGLAYELSEGDIMAVFSQYGEVVNINLVRDRKTGKSKGFAFLCYQDQRSTILAVDNLNTISLLNRIIRVDHVAEYKVPKEFDDITPELKALYNEGCAPKPMMEAPKIEIKRDDKHRPEKDSEKHRQEKRKSRHSDEHDRKKHKKSKKHKHKHRS